VNVLGIPLGVTHGWVLAFLLLAALPLVRPPASAIPYSWRGLLPSDPSSLGLDRVLRAIGSLTLVSLVLAASGLHRSAYEVARVGQGAHMVLLVDRSTSMDQPFGRMTAADIAASNVQPSKGEVARELLSTFVAQRQNDRFGMVVFSTFPIPVLRPTDRHDVVHASIMAGNVGRGLAETDIGAGLEQALEYFEGQPYTGARIVVLVSDGAGEISQTPRLRIAHRMQRLRASLYWIYIRSERGPELFASLGPAGGTATPEMTPELALHAFFSRMGSPYRAYTAESPEDLERAIADVSRLQNLPVRYQETVARRDFTTACLAAALAGLVLLAAARLSERSAW
jgi:mxaC protein